MTRFTAALGPGARTEWGTPAAVFDALHREFAFTIDAAASADNAKCERFWTRDTDGARQSWRGERVFCNPPYGREIRPFVARAARGEAAVAVLLIPACVDTAWWHDHVAPFASVRFLRGRITFAGAAWPAPFPCALAIYDPHTPPHTSYVSIPR